MLPLLSSMSPVLSLFLVTLLMCGPSNHPIWLQKYRINALRFLFGLGKAVPIASLLGDSGWPPIEMQLSFVFFKCWHHLYSMSKDRIPKELFNWSKGLAGLGKKTWYFHLDESLTNVNCSSSNLAVHSRREFAMPFGIPSRLNTWGIGGGRWMDLHSGRELEGVS